MTIPVDRLSYEVDGIPVVSPCLWLEIFLEYAEGPEVLDFYQKVRHALGDRLTQYDLGNGRPKRVSSRSETLVQTWCENPSYAPNKQYFMFMNGAEKGATGSELYVEFWPRRAGTEPPTRGAYPFSVLACAIPLDHPLVSEKKLVQWLMGLDVLSKGAFISGSCGMALTFPYNFPTLEASREGKAHVASALRRYPGLDIAARMIGVRFGLLQLVRQAGDAPPSRHTFIKRVNWLSFVSEKQADLLREQGPLEEQLRSVEGVTVHELPHGLIIQAGEAPQIGDSSRGDFIPVYQSVAHLLRPIRVESVDGGELSHVLQDAGTADWLAAFDTKR